MKKYVILLSILVMMCALVACGKKEEKKEEEVYDAEKAVSLDNAACDTIKSCFNAAMCVEYAYMEAVKDSGNIKISFDGDGDIEFISNEPYTEINKELEGSISDMKAPREKGKSAYCITWNADGKNIKDIKVITVE